MTQCAKCGADTKSAHDSEGQWLCLYPTECALRVQVNTLQATVDVLRGVDCLVDGDGPCGACLKCARASLRDVTAERDEALRMWEPLATRRNAESLRADIAEERLRDLRAAVLAVAETIEIQLQGSAAALRCAADLRKACGVKS